MQSKKLVSIFVGAYRLARPDELLRFAWFRRAFVSAYFVYKKTFEDPFWNLTRRRPELFRNGAILDIGANIGYTACLFSRVLKPGAKLYAFEPDPFSFGLLGEVIRRKKLSGAIEAINIAVGSSEGYVEFWHNDKHSADHRVATERFKSLRPDGAKIATVPLTSVDAFVRSRGLQEISFIKIDVQGYELAVCEGMKDTLERFPGLCVCLEYSPEALVDLGFDPAQLLQFFRARGYRLYILTRAAIQLAGDHASIQEVVEEAGYVDLLCTKSALS